MSLGGGLPAIVTAFPEAISNNEAESQTAVLTSLFFNDKHGREKRAICILHNHKWRETAERVQSFYSEGRGIDSHLVSYDEAKWLDTVRALRCTHFLFFGMPQYERSRRSILRPRTPRSPVDGSSAEADFFTPAPYGSGSLKINNVVVVLLEMPQTLKDRNKMLGHYLDKYLKLSGVNKSPSVIAACALGVFSGPTPMPYKTDQAYWSSTPKMVEQFLPSSGTSLGLTIMTREMAECAPFPRIVLINAISDEYHYDFYSKIARYTHIQSVNGIFLDGLPIERVTQVFKKLPDHHVQMMVRYIHTKSRNEEPLLGMRPLAPETPGLPGNPFMNDLPPHHPLHPTVSSAEAQSRQHRSIDNDADPLPLPLYILGDNHGLCSELCRYLTQEDATTPDSVHTDTSSTSSRSSAPPMHTTMRSMSVPANSLSSTNTPTSNDPHDLANSTDDMHTCESLSSLPNNCSVQRKSFIRGICTSDRCMQREEVPLSKFEAIPELAESPGDNRYVTSPLSPTGRLNRQESSGTLIPRQRFVVHLPKQDLDRQMMHIYFKSAGMYLVVIGIEDLIENPLIQFDNLFYWVNLIHTYVSPDSVKRVFIVGMYNESSVKQNHMIKSVQLINNVLVQYRQAVRISSKEQGCIFLFNREKPVAEVERLCPSLNNLMNIFRHSAKYFAPDLYSSVFHPFKQFNKVVAGIAINVDNKVLESKYEMGQRYQALFPREQVIFPERYFETLSAYSPACISTHSEMCLLMPSIIPEILRNCTKLSKLDTQVFEDPLHRSLPVFSIRLLQHSLFRLRPNQKQFDQIIWWMEHFNIIYSIGNVRGDEKFFVPFLVQCAINDRALYEWDEEKIEEKFKDPTVLYAVFSQQVPTTIHLFHKVVAVIMTSILTGGQRDDDCFIHTDQSEVVLPLYDDDHKEFICAVWIKYRAVQNTIEFRAKINNRLQFLRVVEKKLSTAYLGSEYYNRTIDFNRTVSFHIPTSKHTNETVTPELLALGRLESSQDRVEDHLIATVFLTEPGNRHITAPLRRWADKDPEAKELPPDLFIELSKRLLFNSNWVTVGSRLHLLNSDQIVYWRSQPHKNYGEDILALWRGSDRTFTDLVSVLRELHLDNIANKVESIAMGATPVPLTPSTVHPSAIMEKKLPVEMFTEFSHALNSGDKWALLGSYLGLLVTTEIEALRSSPGVNKGDHVLQLWTDSHLTYQSLINGLKCVHLDRYAQKVEGIVRNHLSSSS